MIGHRAQLTIAVASLVCAAAGCKSPPEWEKGKKILHMPMRSKVDSLDPVRQSSMYSTMARSQVYETLYTYEYLVRPFEITPLLAAAMPEVSNDLRVYTIDLRQGVRFHDDPCFQASGGRGREMTAQDVVDSMKRMADRDNSPGGWWIYDDRIVGFNAFQGRMNRRADGEPFDWAAKIPGLQAIDRYRLRIELERPWPQFLYVLAMHYAAVIPRECAAYYGPEFASRAVGTGPFRLVSWTRGSRLVYERNPDYREAYYPTRAAPEFAKRGLLAAAGKRIPFLDGVVLHIYEQSQPRWLKFRVGDLDIIQVPSEFQSAVYDENLELRDKFRAEDLQYYNLPLLDFIYFGFNMEDPVVGQGERAKYLRQALSLAFDGAEVNKSFYNSSNVLYDGPIPPGLAGHEAGEISPYRGAKLEQARELLARAGYPGGQGLPPIQFESGRSDNSPEQAEMFARQFGRIGVQFEANFNSFPELQRKLISKQAQMFRLSWGADYPDAENFLQLFYGPNKSPGSNKFNYDDPEFNQLYEAIRSMEPGPERTALYVKMRDIIIEDAPAMGSMGRIRFYLWNPRLKNVAPAEVWSRWLKYLDVEL